MSANTDHIEDLIARCLAGEATQEEVSFVEAWKSKSDANRKYFAQLQLIYDQTASTSSAVHFDTDRAWEKVRSRLIVKPEAPTVRLDHGYRMLMRVAAGIIVLITVGFFSYRFFQVNRVSPVMLLSDNNTESDTLPDGSGVFLNRQTKIEYSFQEEKNIHIARLNGEAYFNIDEDNAETFIVEAGGTFIRDIGTSFNVQAYPDSSAIEVVVEQGEVMFYTERNPGINLKAGEKGVFNKNAGTFAKEEPEPNVTAYKTRFFMFNNHSLASVVATLNSVYDKKIRVGDNLKTCKLTVSFDNESLDEIAAIIAETLGLTVSRAGDVIWLKGSGCERTTR